MLQEDDDPLGSFMFDTNTSNSILGNPMTTSMFSSAAYEEDPWGSTSLNGTSSPFATSASYPANLSSISQTTGAHLTSATVLSGIRLPELYEKLFHQYQRSGRVSLTVLNNILSKADISASQIERIMQIVVPNGASYVTQPEFNTAIALLGCAQNKIDISLDNLYRHRDYLPEVHIQPFSNSHILNQNHHPNSSVETIKSPLKPLEDNNPITPEPTNKTNYHHQSASTPTATKNAHQQKPHPGSKSIPNEESVSSIISIYDGATSPTTTPHHKTSFNSNNTTLLNTQHWFQNLEEITVTVAPEREGFIFKHVNYIVTNEKRSSIVLRRYSDFWWLLEVLLKRYPYRTIPNLPPKKLGGRDDAFLEKRRKGLSRFINAIIRHPVLRQDDVVNRFLTEPSELAAWRKQNPPSLDEEFKRNMQPIRDLDDMTPLNVEEQLQQAKKRISAGIKHYVNLCNIMERMIRRMHGQASDFSRYSIALNSLAEAELRYHAGECRNCQRVVRGYETVAKHMQAESNILEENVGSATDDILENLKRVRDLLVAYRDLDERRTRLSVNHTDTISKRLAANRAKVNQNKGVPGMEAEVEKLEEAIRVDEQEISHQQDHETFIKFCMWSELIYVHKQQAFVSSLYQSFVKEVIRFSKLRAENWQRLEEPTFEMPTDVNLFE